MGSLFVPQVRTGFRAEHKYVPRPVRKEGSKKTAHRQDPELATRRFIPDSLTAAGFCAQPGVELMPANR